MSDFVASGVIAQVLPPKTGVSKAGNQWTSQEFLITYEEGQYPKSLCFRVFGADKIQKFGLKAGERVTVHLNIESRPNSNGGFFNDISCWNVERESMQPTQPQGYQQAQQQGNQVLYQKPQQIQQPTADLPF